MITVFVWTLGVFGQQSAGHQRTLYALLARLIVAMDGGQSSRLGDAQEVFNEKGEVGKKFRMTRAIAHIF